MEVKKFKEAAKDLKDNKGQDPEFIATKAKRVIDSRIEEKKEQLVLAELALEKASQEAKADPFKVKEAEILLASVKRSVENEKVIEVETLKEEFYKVWGKEDVASMARSFELYQAIKAAENKKPSESSRVRAAEARLNDLTDFPAVKDAEKTVKAISENLASLEEFRNLAFTDSTQPEAE